MNEATRLVEIKSSEYGVLHRRINDLLKSYNRSLTLLLRISALSPVITLIYWLTVEEHYNLLKVIWALGILFAIVAIYSVYLRTSVGTKYKKLLSIKKELEISGFRIWITGNSPFIGGDIIEVLAASETPQEGKMIPLGTEMTIRKYKIFTEV